MKRKLIIYGIGTFAQYVGYLFENDSDYEVIAYCIEKKIIKTKSFDEKPLVSFEDLKNTYSPESYDIFIAVGNNKIRERFYKLAKKQGYNLATYISTKAQFWPNLKTGDNVFISEGCVLQPFVSIGDNSILIASNIGHHSTIENHTLLSVSTLGGNVQVDDFSFLGMNSVIRHGVQIGKFSLIGMNAHIEKNTQEYSVYSNKETSLRNIHSSKLFDQLLL